jgi:hypothetical protein
MIFLIAQGVVKKNESGSYWSRENCLLKNVNNEIMFSERHLKSHTVKTEGKKRKVVTGISMASLSSIE